MDKPDKFREKFFFAIFIILILSVWLFGVYMKEEESIIEKLARYPSESCASITTQDLDYDYCVELKKTLVKDAIEKCSSSYANEEVVDICLEAWFKSFNLENLDRQITTKK